MSTEGTADAGISGLPEATYSNEGRLYPTPESTQGLGGSPVNASTATTLGLPLVDTTTSAPLSTLAKLAMLGAGGAGIAALNTPSTGGSIDTGAAGPLSGYKFNPSLFRATTPDPAWFRPGADVTTVADAARATPGYAQGGVAKPAYSTKAKLAAMGPWERSLAELNNAAYAARMPTGVAATKASVSQLGQFAQGGIAGLGAYSDGGHMLKGPGDGMSDSIPARIGGKQEARLADGEFVIPADVVSGLGNGSTDAGARQLYKMMDRVRMARTGSKKQGKEINAQKHLPV